LSPLLKWGIYNSTKIGGILNSTPTIHHVFLSRLLISDRRLLHESDFWWSRAIENSLEHYIPQTACTQHGLLLTNMLPWCICWNHDYYALTSSLSLSVCIPQRRSMVVSCHLVVTIVGVAKLRMSLMFDLQSINENHGYSLGPLLL